MRNPDLLFWFNLWARNTQIRVSLFIFPTFEQGMKLSYNCNYLIYCIINLFLICIFLVYENKFSCKTSFSCWLTLLKICQNTVFFLTHILLFKNRGEGRCAAHQNLRLNDLKYIAVDESRLSFVNSYSRQETNFLAFSHCWYFFMLLLKIYANFQSRCHRILYKKISLKSLPCYCCSS